MLIVRREFNEFYEDKKVKKLPDENVINFVNAASWGTVEELDEALKHCDLNAVDDVGMTALHNAAAKLRFDNVDRLLQEIPNGLDPTLKDNFSRDAARAAIESNMNSDKSQKMADKLWPHVTTIADEDLHLYADDAPTEP